MTNGNLFVKHFPESVTLVQGLPDIPGYSKEPFLITIDDQMHTIDQRIGSLFTKVSREKLLCPTCIWISYSICSWLSVGGLEQNTPDELRLRSYIFPGEVHTVNNWITVCHQNINAWSPSTSEVISTTWMAEICMSPQADKYSFKIVDIQFVSWPNVMKKMNFFAEMGFFGKSITFKKLWIYRKTLRWLWGPPKAKSFTKSKT